MRTPTTTALTLAAALALAGCTAQTPQPPQASPSSTATGGPASSACPSSQFEGEVRPDGTPQIRLTGLTTPWSITFHGATALISERDTGNILEVLSDGGTRLVGTIDDVHQVGESGLLGLTVDDQQRLYAYSTAISGNRIQRFALAGQPGSLSFGAAETIIDGLPFASYHDGGRIAFGPDGMLYASVGDAGDRDSAQDLESFGGKILRLTPDGNVPDDNPFPDSPVYSYGHRNPQGIAWAANGTMFASEFGQNTWDELNIITPGGNYGWPTVEGIGGDDQFIDPVQQWAPSEASPSGIAIAGHTVFIANLRGQSLRTVPVTALASSEVHYRGEYGRIRDVALAPSGELWFLTSNTDSNGTPGSDDDHLFAVSLTS